MYLWGDLPEYKKCNILVLSSSFQFESDECYILASLLDPRFKITKCRWCETEKVDKYVDLLRNKVKLLSSSVDVDLDYCSPPCKQIKTEDFFSCMPSNPSRKRNPSGFISEIDDYISEPCTEMSENPFMYWQINRNIFPLLSNLARKYICHFVSSNTCHISSCRKTIYYCWQSVQTREMQAKWQNILTTCDDQM